MATVKICGHSDDLVEVRGDAPGCDEFDIGGRDEGFVELSNGLVFRVFYADGGVWKVRPHAGDTGSQFEYSTIPHGEGEDPEVYTDTVTVTGDIEWVRFCPKWPMTAAAKARVVGDYLEMWGTDGVPESLVEALYKVVSVRGDRP